MCNVYCFRIKTFFDFLFDRFGFGFGTTTISLKDVTGFLSTVFDESDGTELTTDSTWLLSGPCTKKPIPLYVRGLQNKVNYPESKPYMPVIHIYYP